MNENQLRASLENMVTWLSHPQELGKVPRRIECAGQFSYNEMHYYIFRFKPAIIGKWLVGVSGGFEGEDLTPCGHTYSDMQPYCEMTAQADCIKMIEKIMAYWKRKAEEYPN